MTNNEELQLKNDTTYVVSKTIAGMLQDYILATNKGLRKEDISIYISNSGVCACYYYKRNDTKVIEWLKNDDEIKALFNSFGVSVYRLCEPEENVTKLI